MFWGSYASIFAFASVYLLAKGFTNTQVGYVIAAGSAASALIQPLVGGYADRSKNFILHKMIIMLSFVMIGVSGLLFGFGKSLLLVALLYGLLVLFLQVITPLTYSLGMFFMEKGIPINFGICRGIGSITYALVASLLGVLVDSFGEEAIILSVIILYGFLILAVYLFHFPNVSETKEGIASQEEKEHNSTVAFLKERKCFFMILLGNTLAFVSHNIIGNYMFQIVSYNGYTSKEMGFAVSLAAACELPTLFFLSQINKKISTANLLRISVIFIFIKNLCLYFASSLWMIYFSMSLQLLGYGLFAGISVIYVKETIEAKNQTTGQALMTMTVTAGAVIGSLLGGRLLDIIDVPGMLLISGIMAFLGAIIVTIFAARKEKV